MSKIVQQHIACEHCGSSDAKCSYDDGHTYCFSCRRYTRGDQTIADSSAFTYEFLPWRGIHKETMAFYGTKTKIGPNGEPVSVGFRHPDGTYLVRHVDRKDFYWDKPSLKDTIEPGLFGRDKFSTGSHKYVTITEGALDAESLYQALGKAPVVSVRSASTAITDCVADRSWLNDFERIYLAFDNDARGREITAAVAKLFDYNKVFVLKFSNRKDANEYLQHGEDVELRNIWNNSKKFLPETIVSSFQDFAGILNSAPQPGIAYPFPTLTSMTYGIRQGESVLITAKEGVGKTEIMHAIEYKLLKETTDGIGAIFLEEPKKRHLQALAGLELHRPVHLPDCGCTDAEVFEALRKAITLDERFHLYSHFGSDDPEVLLDTIRFLVSARNVRYVLLDHITMAVSGLGGDDVRRALDYLTTRLEMMVKELSFALIMVSHVNDNGETRDSRMAGKIADIRIDLSRDVLHDDPFERNTTYLTVSKNRFSGRTGSAGSIIFNPLTYSYTEAANDNFNSNQGGNLWPREYTIKQ